MPRRNDSGGAKYWLLELFGGFCVVAGIQQSKESGLSEGSIYHYFGEKAGILDLVMEQSQSEILAILPEEPSEAEDPRDIIYRYLCKELEIYESLGSDLAYVAITRKTDKTGHAVSTMDTLLALVQPALTEYIRKCMERGMLKSNQPAEIVSYILTAEGAGLTSIWTTHGKNLPLHEYGAKAFACIVYKLFDA